MSNKAITGRTHQLAVRLPHRLLAKAQEIGPTATKAIVAALEAAWPAERELSEDDRKQRDYAAKRRRLTDRILSDPDFQADGAWSKDAAESEDDRERREIADMLLARGRGEAIPGITEIPLYEATLPTADEIRKGIDEMMLELMREKGLIQ